jgi:hypothetical protein
MALENIKETVAAFQTHPDAIISSAADTRTLSNERPRLGVLFAIGGPIIFVLAYSVNWLMVITFGPSIIHYHGLLGRFSDIIISIFVSFFMTRANWAVLHRVPLASFNPYFGRHLDETIGAFSKR